jgi:hypothetical protein
MALRVQEGGAMKPLAIDLFCGLGGWTEGLLAEGYDVVGFDIERHVYGAHRYPAQLVLQDVLTLHGSQFKNAALIVASPPCQEYSYMAMPWKRAKAKAAAIRADATGAELERLNRLFNACLRIQFEASLAAGRHVPLIIENVKGAQPWVGRARWSFGSFFLWGNVPALMPFTSGRRRKFNPDRVSGFKNDGGSWFAIAHNKTSGKGQNPDGRKVSAKIVHVRDGHPHTRHLTDPADHEGIKQRGSGRAWWDKALDERRKEATTTMRDGIKRPGIELGEIGFNVANALAFGHMVEGVKIKHSEKDKRDYIGTSRKFASAMIAKIPLPLARHIAATFRP